MLKLLGLVMLLAIGCQAKTLHTKNLSFLEDNEIRDVEELSNPPNYKEYAKMARYLVHISEWTSMGTISTVPTIKGFPMVNIIAVSDSEKDKPSTGNIYFYLTLLDFTAQDLKKDNRLTVLFSMDQNLACTKDNIDPMEPTCARIMISGSAVKLTEGTPEFDFGTAAMISRHPASVHWKETHSFFLCKLDISQIVVLDYYGGPHFVTSEEYFNASLDNYARKSTLTVGSNKISSKKVIDEAFMLSYLKDSSEIEQDDEESISKHQSIKIKLRKNRSVDEIDIEL